MSNRMSGATKETTGNIVGSDDLRAKGRAQREEGRAQREEGNAHYDGTQTHGTLGTHDEHNEHKGPSKTTGQLHAAKGAVKESLGSIFKNDSLEHTGAHERNMGNQEIEAARTQNVAEGATGRVKGTVKENVGYATGNPQKEAEGRGENIRGQAQYNANK